MSTTNKLSDAGDIGELAKSIVHYVLRTFPRSDADHLTVDVEGQLSAFIGLKNGVHIGHVRRFLLGMYQTMVDPVEEFHGNISQLCALLLQRAREDREKLNVLSSAGTSGTADAKLCGDFVISVIAGASWIPCGLPKGHDGGHRGAGTCIKHGKYFGGVGEFPQCPAWPSCIADLGLRGDSLSRGGREGG